MIETLISENSGPEFLHSLKFYPSKYSKLEDLKLKYPNVTIVPIDIKF